MIEIDTIDGIHLSQPNKGADLMNTGLQVTQTKAGTVVYTPERPGQHYSEHKMPQARYSLAHDKPASGAAGRAQFEADIRALLESLN